MNTETLYEQCFKNSNSKDSKSVANALRALNERIKELELENNELKDRLIVIDSRANNDREKWQIRMMEEVQIAKDKEDVLRSKLVKKDEEIRELKERLKNTNGAEGDKGVYLEEIRGLTEKIMQVKQRIGFEENYQEKTKTVPRIKPIDTKKLITSSKSDNLEVKNLSFHQSSLDPYQAKKDEDLLVRFLVLESKFNNLNKENVSQSRLIEDLKKEVSRLSRISKNSTPKSRSKRIEKFSNKNDSKVVHVRSTSQSNRVKESARCTNSCPVKENIEEEVDVRRLIEDSEKKLEQLNLKYRNLIGVTGQDPVLLSNIRKDLNLVAGQIDLQSDELFELKKKHQQWLKSKLYS